jgi:Na+-transporting methylmalonyl-CoA/oxaloacetate decarboxylase gamma subunit
MNKYGYNIYINKYIDSFKIGYRNKGSLSSEWIFGLEFPIFGLVHNSNLNTLESMGVIFASLIVLYLIVQCINYLYNKNITNKLLNAFQYIDRDKKSLMNVLDAYIQKHKNHKHSERFRERIEYLENAKKCVKEYSDHLI